MKDNEQKKFDKEFRQKEKKAGEKLKRELAKRSREIPIIINVLEAQRDLLSYRECFAGIDVAYRPPLHDIIQNLSVYAPEFGVKYMLDVCISVNGYALKKIGGIHLVLRTKITAIWNKIIRTNKAKPYKTELDVLQQQANRLAELSDNKYKDDIIHPFTEIVDNLLLIVPEKYLIIADALNAYNDAALEFYKITAQNYKQLKLGQLDSQE